MILTCPQCATRYQADAAAFPPAGRTVRCGKCRHTWHQPRFVAEMPRQPVSTRPIEPRVETCDRALRASADRTQRAATASRQRHLGTGLTERVDSLRGRHGVVVAGWGVFIATVLLIAFSVTRYGSNTAMIWPRLGSPQSLASRRIEMQGIDLRKVGYRREIYDGQVMLVLSGTLSNDADRALPVPKTIHVTLSDENNHQLFDAAIPAKVARLGPGESVMFQARVHDLPSTNPRLHMGLQD